MPTRTAVGMAPRHAQLGELTEKEVPVLDALCRAILEYVYGAPDLVARVKARLDGLRGKDSAAT